MIVGYPIPPFFAAKDENGSYSMLDGRQRCNAISSFINSEFELAEDTPDIDYDGEIFSIAGCNFEGLPEDLQELIDNKNNLQNEIAQQFAEALKENAETYLYSSKDSYINSITVEDGVVTLDTSDFVFAPDLIIAS